MSLHRFPAVLCVVSCNNLFHKVSPQIPLRTALISEIIQRSICLFQPVNPAHVRFLLSCWPFLTTANHFKPFLFRSEQTFHLNSEIRLVVSQSLKQLPVFIARKQNPADCSNVPSMTCDMDVFLRKSAIFFSYQTLLQHLIHQLLIAVYMVICHKTIRQFCEEFLGAADLGLLDWA